MSKPGQTPLLWIMIVVAWVHVAAPGPEADRYHRLVAKGKPKGVAIAALAAHLMGLAYQLLMKEEAYPHTRSRRLPLRSLAFTPDNPTDATPSRHKLEGLAHPVPPATKGAARSIRTP